MRPIETESTKLYNTVRRELFACMETGNYDRARIVLAEYKQVAMDSDTLQDLSEDLRSELVKAYGQGF